MDDDLRTLYQRLYDAPDGGTNSRAGWNKSTTEWSFVHVDDNGVAYKIIVEVLNGP